MNRLRRIEKGLCIFHKCYSKIMRTIINVSKPCYDLLNEKSKTKYDISLTNLAPKNYTESSDKPLLSTQIWKTH